MYATEWTSDYIRVWFFPRSAIPNNIKNGGQPDPSKLIPPSLLNP